MEAILEMLHADGLLGTAGMAILGMVLYYNRVIIKDLRSRIVQLEAVQKQYISHLENNDK